MKWVTYTREGRGGRQQTCHGLLDGDEVAELGDGDLLSVIGDGVPAHGFEMERIVRARLPLADVTLLAPLQRPGKLLAAAANYQEHVVEGGGPELDKSRISPRLFLKPSTSIVGPDAEISVPAETKQMDWEAELGVVIGRRCRNVAVADALDVVFGYVAANDVSARSLDLGYARDTDDKAVWFFDWLAGKWFDGFCPLGPWVLTADQVPDPQDLGLEFTLNGEVRQQGSTAAMIFSVAELVAHASRLMTLEPGDVLLTGTLAGTGVASGRFLAPGDEMAVSITGLGVLTTRVV